MRWILKLLTAPIVLTIDLFTLACVGIISCSAILFRIVSSIVALLGVMVLVTYSPKERDHSFGYCISCQPDGVADVRGEDSGHPSEFFPFLKGNLIHTHVHVPSQHQKYSSFID